jgi:peptidyl-prolyl cis-trans isomerase D
MFEFVRNHKKWMQVLLALIIAPMFIIGGFGLTNNGGDGAVEVAMVNDKKVTQQEFDEAQRQAVDRARQTEGDAFDPKKFETPEAKKEIFDNLLAIKAVDAEISKSNLTVSDEVVMKEIAKEGAFKKPDGTFDLDAYKGALAAQNMRPTQYQELLRRDLTLQQLNTAVVSSAFAPRSVAARISQLGEQEREVQELLLPLTEFVPKVQVTPEMIKAYYDKNAALFQVPESVKAEYVVFDANAIEKLVKVEDAEVAQFYEGNKDKFKTPEERKASHILITVKPNDPAQKAAAKLKAEKVLAEVRAAPANFAAIAKTSSEDIASAELGGDLGRIDDKSADPQLLAPIRKLKQGEVSDLVETSYGYHILTVTGLVPERIKPLDEAKPLILAELKKQKMSKKYSELAETFNNTLDDRGESLQPVAEKMGLTVQVADKLTPTPSPALGDSPINNIKFLKALFAADSLKTKRNIPAVEVAPSVLVSGRVLEHKPASTRPLAEVEPVIRQRVTQEEAAKLAQKAGEAKIAAAKAAGDAAGFGETKVVSRTKAPAIAPAAMRAVLKADVTKLPAYVGVDVPGVGYGVYRIGKLIQPPQLDAARSKAEAEQITNVIAEQEMVSYIDALKVKAKAKVVGTPTVVAEAK